MKKPNYKFLKSCGKIINSGQSRSLFLTGNINDLFYLENLKGDGKYVPIVNFLVDKWNVSNKILMVYELNGPIRFINEVDKQSLRNAWISWRNGGDIDQLLIDDMLGKNSKKFSSEVAAAGFDKYLEDSIGRPTHALELLRQFCLCSRSKNKKGDFLLEKELLIIIEGGDLILSPGNLTSLSEGDRHRINICRDWFSDPEFMDGEDSVVILTESMSLINDKISTLPQLLTVEVESPNFDERTFFIMNFNSQLPKDKKIKIFGTQRELAQLTAGLSIQALRQLLKGVSYKNEKLKLEDVVIRVEKFIQSQVGEDVVEFKRPTHTLKDVVGFKKLKKFMKEELIPRFSVSGDMALPGAAVSGPIGAGKTFIFEAMASELDMVVIVLKNIRSQWFGQTDVIFERLKRVLTSLSKVMIFVDEADTQFGSVGKNAHSTERRLTGKIQAMMSDVSLRGKVIWLLMTARINLLSPDIRRPGRVGDLIIPVLDPDGEDREDFIRWMLSPVIKNIDDKKMESLKNVTEGFSAAFYASIRSELKSLKNIRKMEFEDILNIIDDRIPPAIGETRRYQELQALVNCTRKSLLPDSTNFDEKRKQWFKEIREMEKRGIN